MKATLSFVLPEETLEHLDALHGWEWKAVVREICEQLRSYQKHGHSFANPDDCIEELQTIVYALMEQRNLSPE